MPESRLVYGETSGKVHRIDMPEGLARMLAGQKKSNAKFKNPNDKIRK